MKMTLLSMAGAFMLAGAVLISSNVTVHASQAPRSAAAQRMKGKSTNHPDIEAAIKHLQAAKESMEKAQKDFGGHRGNALKLTNEAIQELRDGIKFANKK